MLSSFLLTCPSAVAQQLPVEVTVATSNAPGRPAAPSAPLPRTGAEAAALAAWGAAVVLVGSALRRIGTRWDKGDGA